MSVCRDEVEGWLAALSEEREDIGDALRARAIFLAFLAFLAERDAIP
jgi:hypothetical protein